MTKIVGLHGIAKHRGKRLGSARVGKDEVARFLTYRGYYHTSFAKPMYKVVNDVYGIETSNLTDFDKEEKIYQPWDMTLRQILQSIGDAFRMLDNEFFLKCLMVDIGKNAEEGQHVVVSDVRYDNEAEFIRSLGGTVVHVQRPVDIEKYKINPHSSEVGVERTTDDLDIFNNSTLEHLESQVVNLTILLAEQLDLNY